MFGWRKATWSLLIFDILMAWLLISTLGASPDGSGAGPVAAFIAGLWLAGFTLLGVIWLVTRPDRVCPQCGRRVKTGRYDCGSCGHSFLLNRP